MAIEVGDAVWRIKGDTSDLDSAVDRSEANIAASFNRASQTVGAAMGDVSKTTASSMRQISASMQEVGQSVRTVGYTMTAAGVGIGAALGYAVKSSMDWETAFTGVKKTVEGTPEQIQAIADGLRAMSLEIPVAATELARFAEIGGQMGVPREQILAFTRVIAILGTTTNIAGEEGAAMLAQFANVAQVPQSQYSNLAASIVSLGNAGSSTEAEILALAQRLAAAGTIAGLSAGDILGISNALVGVGIEAEAGGTAFSKLFVDMKNATMSGGEQLQTLAAVAGMSAQQFAEAFNTDPALAISTFIQGLQSIEQQGGNVFMVMDQLGYSEVRMRNALLSSAMAADTLTGSIKLGNSAFQENNAHTKEAAVRFETGESKAQLMKNAFAELATAIGDSLRPTTDGLMISITELVTAMAEWVMAHPELVTMITKVAAVLGTLLIAAGAVFIAIGTIIGVVAGAVAAFATLAASTVGTAVAAIATAIVIAIGWIVAAVVAMVAYWDQGMANLKAIWNGIASAFWYVFGPIIEAIQQMTGWGIGPGGGMGGGPVGMATGGTVKQSGWAVVGERGPELVQMPQGATVYDAEQSRPALNGGATAQGGQSVTINFNRDSVRSEDDIRQIERAITRLISSGMTAGGARAYA